MLSRVIRPIIKQYRPMQSSIRCFASDSVQPFTPAQPTQSFVARATGQALANPFNQEEVSLSADDRAEVYRSIENVVAQRDFSYFLQLEDFDRVTVRILDEYQADNYG